MKILLIGYGKMGKTIERLAASRGHEIVGTITSENAATLSRYTPALADVAIEFTRPDQVVQNLKQCFAQGLPVVCGTTGWQLHHAEIEQACKDHNGALFHASNFSIGVNLFFHFSCYMAKKMAAYPGYSISIDETHHTEKLDRPSGTAIKLAEDILQYHSEKKRWVNEPSDNLQDLVINSYREEHVIGTHKVQYASPIDALQLTHTAFSRDGFATGALLAAEFLLGKKGLYGMSDLLHL